MTPHQDIKNMFKHISIDDQDPLTEQLKDECEQILKSCNGSEGDREKRTLALLGLQVLHLRETAITRQECAYFRRSRVPWPQIAISIPGFVAMITLLLQIFGIL